MKTQLTIRTITLLIGVAVALIVGFTLLYSYRTELLPEQQTSNSLFPKIVSIEYKDIQKILTERFY